MKDWKSSKSSKMEKWKNPRDWINMFEDLIVEKDKEQNSEEEMN
jgi:hypothetical protein